MSVPGTMPTIRVMIVDDHVMVRHGLVALIHTWPDLAVVAEASDGLEALVVYRAVRPDIVLMDLRIPKLDGIDVIATLRKEFPAGRFMVLTTYEEDANVRHAMEVGAAGYLLKDAPSADLNEAIRAVHAGRTWFPQPPALRTAGASAGTATLTAREMEVLRLLAKGLSNKEISAALGVAQATVKTHVSALMDKLDVTARTQAVIVAAERGLIRLG